MIIKGKSYSFRMNRRDYHCALDITMDYIGGKWKTVLLWYLRNKTLRFGELKSQVPDITEKMLSLQLKKLEEDGIVKRTVYNEQPPRVEYSLTEFGQTLTPVIEAIARWGRHLGETKGRLVERK